MFITILDYVTATTIVEEVKDEEIIDAEEYVADKMGHSNYYFMTSDNLDIQIQQLNKDEVQIITKSPTNES